GAVPDSATAPAPSSEYSLRLGGVGPAVGCCVALLLAVALYARGWRNDAVHQFREVARQLGATADEADHQRQVTYLEYAAQLAPEHARLQIEAGQAHLQLFQDGSTKFAQELGALQAPQTILAATSSQLTALPASGLGQWFVAS